MSPIRVTVEGKFKFLTPQDIMAAFEEAMDDCDNLLANEARNLVHVRTGGTRASIRTVPVRRTGNGVQGGVEVGGAGRFLEQGTATFSTNPDVRHEKYPIRPKNKKALAWPGAQGPSENGAPVSHVQFGQGLRPPVAGNYVRLSGAVRLPISRLMHGGSIPFQSVLIVRKGVMHPGIRPRPFLAPALKAVAPKFGGLLAAALARRMR